jgi:hypothetical protein
MEGYIDKWREGWIDRWRDGWVETWIEIDTEGSSEGMVID